MRPQEPVVAVEIVRSVSGWEYLIVLCGTLLLRAFVIMLTVGELAPHLHLGFRHACLVVLLAGALFQTDQYALWTRARKRIGR